MRQDKLIELCFFAHVDDLGGVDFSFLDYYDFWVNHKVGQQYELKNRNGSIDVCKVAYYPLPYYKDLRALIEIDKGDYNDFREVPVKFLKAILPSY